MSKDRSKGWMHRAYQYSPIRAASSVGFPKPQRVHLKDLEKSCNHMSYCINGWIGSLGYESKRDFYHRDLGCFGSTSTEVCSTRRKLDELKDKT